MAETNLLQVLCLSDYLTFAGGACVLWPDLCGWRRRRIDLYHIQHVSREEPPLCISITVTWPHMTHTHTHILCKFSDLTTIHFLYLLSIICFCVCMSVPVQSVEQLPFLRLTPLLPDSLCHFLDLLRGHT